MGTPPQLCWTRWDLDLLLQGVVRAEGFGPAFHCLGGDLDAGQQLQLLATLFEGSLAADHRRHAAHPG